MDKEYENAICKVGNPTANKLIKDDQIHFTLYQLHLQQLKNKVITV